VASSGDARKFLLYAGLGLTALIVAVGMGLALYLAFLKPHQHYPSARGPEPTTAPADVPRAEPGAGALASAIPEPGSSNQGHGQPAGQWPFKAPVPDGFTLAEVHAEKEANLCILKGRQLEGVQEVLLVVRVDDLPDKAVLGKCLNCAIWAAESSVGIPVGTSDLQCGITICTSTKWAQALVGLGNYDPVERVEEVFFRKGSGKNASQSPPVSAYAGIALEGKPYWLFVAGATRANEKDVDHLKDTIHALCAALKGEQ
jgi:hypothetical protein